MTSMQRPIGRGSLQSSAVNGTTASADRGLREHALHA